MKKLSISKPAVSDRIIGFTIPRNGKFYICDHDEVWISTIGHSPQTEVTDHPPYEFVKNNADFLGLLFKGEVANAPLMRTNGSEINYVFDPTAELISVNYKADNDAGKIEFRILSGDWFAASLSYDGKYLILAEPYNLAVYEL